MPHTVDVVVRVRPLLSSSAEPPTRFATPFASAIVHGSDQSVVFDIVAQPLLHKLDEGYSCSLLAYGQTGSGKTYTQFGPTGCLTEAALARASPGRPPEPWGLFPRVALRLLREAQAAAESGNDPLVSTTLSASAIEVYNNKAYDLLDGRAPLAVGRCRTVAQRNGNDAVYRGNAKPDIGGANKFRPLVGADGSHPASCSCRLCFAAKHKAKLERGAGEGDARRAAAIARMEARAAAKKGSGAASKRGATRSGGSSQAAARARSGEGFRTVGETVWPLASAADVAKLARHVEHSRAASGHDLNDRSSRSHCLVRLHVAESTCSGGGGGGGGRSARGAATSSSAGKKTLRSKEFLFVDLAGSERVKKSKVEGQRMEEAAQINKSLTVLGRVIRALSESSSGGAGGTSARGLPAVGGRARARSARGAKRNPPAGTRRRGASTKPKTSHVPYRDSTLTMLLRSSFEPSSSVHAGGGAGDAACAHSALVVNVASELAHADESACSLRFGARMSRVANVATKVSVLLCTVTFYANIAHSLTRSP
jgi:hypothetical protein